VKVWIGGNYTAGAIQWMTGEAPIYSAWRGGYPNPGSFECMQMMLYNSLPLYHGRWLQDDCDVSFYYVCEKDIA